MDPAVESASIRWVTENREVTTWTGTHRVAGMKVRLADCFTGAYEDRWLSLPQAITLDPKGLLSIAHTGDAVIRAIPFYENYGLALRRQTNPNL